MSPNVYIVAGPNGVGKTTFARTFLPKYAECRNFINADLIAQGIAPFAPDTAAVRAGRIMLQQIQDSARRGIDFAFETTLSGRSYLNLIRQLDRWITKSQFSSCGLPQLKSQVSESRKEFYKAGITSQKLINTDGSIGRSETSLFTIDLWQMLGSYSTTPGWNLFQLLSSSKARFV